ncbi:MAG: prophage regulatory protein [Hyphomicrobiaceae bacterium]|jgi:prophage regulatory protein
MTKKLTAEKLLGATQLPPEQAATHELVEGLPSDLLSAYKRHRVLSADAVLDIVPFGRTQLHKLSHEGLFPHPIRLSIGRVAWIEREVLEWLKQRQAERDQLLAERDQAHREAAA